MPNLSTFQITKKWPAAHPDRIQLYSLPTPNGVKVSIMLEETGLPYEVHLVDITKNESWTPEFLSLNPNGKIPAILDPDGPGGKPLALFESGAIVIHIAEKSEVLMPRDAAGRAQAISHVFAALNSIEQFIQTHRLPAEVKISDAGFWSEGQRAFLKEAYKTDNHWNPIVDDLNALLHD